MYEPDYIRAISFLSGFHRAQVGKSVGEVEKRFTNQIPELDPREDQSIKEERFVELLRKVETVEDKLATSTLQEKLKKDGQDIIVSCWRSESNCLL